MEQRRKFTVEDVRQIRKLVFGTRGKGVFHVRSSPEDDGTERGGQHVIDCRLWDQSGQGSPVHDDLDFPIGSDETGDDDQRHWPEVYEGITLDLYLFGPSHFTEPQRFWTLQDNADVALQDGEWRIA